MTDMKTSPHPKANKLKTALRIAAAGFYIALASYAGWVIVTRWNLKPAVVVNPAMMANPRSAYLPPIDPALDRTAEIDALVASLPIKPPFSLPPLPAGKKWSVSPSPKYVVDITCVPYGPWDLERRPLLAASVEYLMSPEIEYAIDRVRVMEPGGYRGARLSGIRTLAWILVGRARIFHAGDGNIQRAIKELSTLSHLNECSAHSSGAIGAMTAAATRALALDELRHMLCEHDINMEELRLVRDFLDDAAPDVADLWTKQVNTVFGDLRGTLDRSFAPQEDGGWLVLSFAENLWWEEPALQPRSGAWNALSVFFNNRQAVERKLAQAMSNYDALGQFSFPATQERMKELSYRSPFDVTDGPLRGCVEHMSGLLLLTFRQAYEDRAALIIGGLSAYRGIHGQYPRELSQLKIELLDKVPTDPITLEEYAYSSDGDTFQLDTSCNESDDLECGPDIRNFRRFPRERAPFYSEPVIEDESP